MPFFLLAKLCPYTLSYKANYLNKQPGAMNFIPRSTQEKSNCMYFNQIFIKNVLILSIILRNSTYSELPIGSSYVNGILLLTGCVKVHLV